MKKYKWGILTAGKMSAKFVKALRILENAELYAVAAREADRAKAFAAEYGFKKYYSGYEALANDPEVDIIYIASPHSHHFEHVMLCLKNRKPVLCEKAFSINKNEVEEMINEAKKHNVFIMEALWPPFQPFYKKAHEILQSGVAGRIINMSGWFSFIPSYNPAGRAFNIDLGGGSLLDIGIYPVIDALTFIGVPDEITAMASFAPTGSEESINVIFRYKDGRMASLYSSFRTDTGIGCKLYCEKGNLQVLRDREMNQKIILELHGKERHEYNYFPDAMGYHWEAEEVMKCLSEGRTESSVVPLSFSRDLINTLDRIRNVAGIVYPGR